MAKNCTVGTSCGATCINSSLSCNRQLSLGISLRLDKMIDAVLEEREEDRRLEYVNDLSKQGIREVETALAIIENPMALEVALEGEMIGAGAYGMVFVKDDLALKVAKEGSILSQEVEIAEEMGKAGVGPEIHDSIRNSDGYYAAMLMERIEGKTLSQRMEDAGDAGVVGFREMDILDNFFNRREKMHRAGIIHGDLHNENVMVSDDNKVKIIDWGMARKFDTARVSVGVRNSIIREAGEFIEGDEEIYLPLRDQFADKSDRFQRMRDNLIILREKTTRGEPISDDWQGFISEIYDG
jgi:tRNA A-37 threonylcarbamoyl transferase component Bud32